MPGEDRRKHDDAFKSEMLRFMARIDERNINKDLANAVVEERCICHDERITSLEHSRTQMKTVSAVAASGFGVWLMNKLGIHF